MSLTWSLVLLGGLLAGVYGFVGFRSEDRVLVLMGDTDGYLSPCGCTKPMTGGIKRRAAAVHALTSGKPATILENGGFVRGTGRQDRFKADAVAESLRHMGVVACNLTPDVTRLGMGSVLSVRNLAGEIFVQSNIVPHSTIGVQEFITDGPFLIGALCSNQAQISGALGEKVRPTFDAAVRLVEAAKEAELVPILLLAGGRLEAEQLANAVPELRLIQYRSTGRPLPTLLRVGETVLVSPGEHGKFVLRLLFQDGKFSGYSPVELGPEFTDDLAVTRVYNRYLRQVEDAKLLEALPRAISRSYFGSSACLSCHTKAAAIWKSSQHSHALRTLIKEGHGRDPDCVGCHVVALDKVAGFRSVRATPQLANVGCEACHGPGVSHVKSKGKSKMGKAGSKACAPCHTLENSPGFEFEPYWKKIKH